ncbi:hypothetical protein NM688_g2485 [Phlebia brevispora]|uniref:Uncharacterized protein n=1 Tax=Phlebia brevispora TaxID=194682 RepID=A0ACC1T8K2_9APHY|nr:hypothetical protein NM688_g2485 [Phlebia brevispora]
MSLPRTRPRRQTRDRSRDRALLIGIEYQYPPRHGVPPLSRPHKDVQEFRKHLIRKWRYLEENIVVLLDMPGTPKNRLPTRANILYQIDLLVSQAQPGDHLTFYFAGHCYQLVSHDKHEADGYDEAILTLDHNGEPVNQDNKPLDPENILDEDRCKLEGVIVDNELRRRLVDPLDDDVQLVSLFDTCHSGTLLALSLSTDLTHYWTNKVKRAFSGPSQTTRSSQRFPPILNKRTPRQHSGTSPSISVTLNGTTSSSSSRRQTAPLPLIIRTDSMEIPRCLSPTAMEFTVDDDEKREDEPEQGKVLNRSRRPLPAHLEQSFQQATLAPVPSRSSGTSSGRSSPRVVSISPAEDHQVTWENPQSDALSFTASVISVWDQADRDLSLREFMNRLRFRIFMQVTKTVAEYCRKKKRSLGNAFRNQRRAIMNNQVPSPQIGSMQPLDMNAPFGL